MGNPSCIWIIENDRRRFYHDKYGAVTLDQYLFWGEDFMVKLAESLIEMKDFSDPGWEGGIVVDRDRKILLWWQRYYHRTYPVSFRWLIDMMKITWPGWVIRYAPSEDDDIWRYLIWRLSRIQTPVPDYECSRPTPETVFAQKSYSRFLLTYRNLDRQIFHYDVQGLITDTLCAGPGIVPFIQDRLPNFSPRPYDQNNTYDDLLFVDMQSRTMWMYESYSQGCRATLKHIRQHWSGWQVNYHFGWIFTHCSLAGMDWREYFAFPEDYLDRFAQHLSLQQAGAYVIEDLDAVLEINQPTNTAIIIPGSTKARLRIVKEIIKTWQSAGGSIETSLQQPVVWEELLELFAPENYRNVR